MSEYNTIKYNKIQYNTIQYNATQYNDYHLNADNVIIACYVFLEATGLHFVMSIVNNIRIVNVNPFPSFQPKLLLLFKICRLVFRFSLLSLPIQ